MSDACRTSLLSALVCCVSTALLQLELTPVPPSLVRSLHLVFVWLSLPLAYCLCLSCISSPLAVSEFMIQGGDVTGTGKGNVSVWGTTFANEVNEAVRFSTRGLLAMANAYPKADTNGCQFFLTLDSAPHLNGTATIFGKYVCHVGGVSLSLSCGFGHVAAPIQLLTCVLLLLCPLVYAWSAAAPCFFHRHRRVIHGNDTLAAIEAVPVDADDRPLTPVTIDRVTIHANPLADRPSAAALLGQA